MKQKLSLVTLGVNDVMLSRRFYEELLEFEPLEGTSETVAFYDMGGVLLGLYQLVDLAEDAQVSAGGEGFSRMALAHNEGSVEEVDALFEELRDRGVEIVKEPEEVFWGGYSGYFKDLDGHLWEVAYNPAMDLT